MKGLLRVGACVLALAFLAGCGQTGRGGDADGSPASPSPSPSPEGETSGEEQPPPSAELHLVAQGVQFDKDRLAAPAGSHVLLTLENRDPVPHNFALYRSEAAQESVFVGDTFGGPDTARTYEFDAPDDPGTYFFRCDVHPTTMTGDFVVE